MDCHLIGDEAEKFFLIVHTTPDHYEALDLIERARAATILKKQECVDRKLIADEHAYARTLTRLNAEKKRINNVINDMDWMDAIKSCLGAEALDEVVTYRRKIYRDGMGILSEGPCG